MEQFQPELQENSIAGGDDYTKSEVDKFGRQVAIVTKLFTMVPNIYGFFSVFNLRYCLLF